MNSLFNDPYHAKIEAVPAGIRRLLWTVLIPTHNCACYLRGALISVLDQDPGPEKMEIIVVDDHSTQDDPEAVVKEIGKGRVQFIRQAKNVGKVKNYETGLLESRGTFIHQLHGDDRVRHGFYKKMEELHKNFPEAGAAFCQSYYINEKGEVTGRTGEEQKTDGILENGFEKIAVRQRIQTPSIVVKREVYEQLGGFDRRLDCFEDWEMWLRIAAYYPFAYSKEILAEYRASANSTTHRTLRNGSRFKTLRQVISRMDDQFKDKITKETKKSRSYVQAEYWLNFIPGLVKERIFSIWIAVVREALCYSFSFKIFKRATSLTLRSLIR